MTMAKKEAAGDYTIGLPDDLRGLSLRELADLGWRQLIGTPKPAELPEPGYRWVYASPFEETESGDIIGTWTQETKARPYPSWTWVDGTGWAPPVAMPTDGQSYAWDEEGQRWVVSQTS